jgi:bifunctional NMN adenylyltransferase/nudix hydrolase
MKIKTSINPKDYEIGVIMARFQAHKLHEGQIGVIDEVFKNHKKVIIFLGVTPIGTSRNNPLDFATRKAMVQERYPNAVILPQLDNRSDENWSKTLDAQIQVPFGQRSAVLYGSRDSFIPHYHGKYPVIELVQELPHSGTQLRIEAASQIVNSEDFRAGIIHGIYSQWPVTYPTVDIVVVNDDKEFLLAKKPNENKYRFIGGFVDRSDESYEMAAARELSEETGGHLNVDMMIYVASGKINDWRYEREKSGIMSTLFITKKLWGHAKPTDDIAELEWVKIEKLKTALTENTLKNMIMEEHIPFMTTLLGAIETNPSIKNLL